jgi:glutaredoxin 3
MAKVTIYTRAFCGYCARAVNLLKSKGAEITEYDAGSSASLRDEMVTRSGGGRTYPQIFIGETYVGGCDELHALDARGGLDPLLRVS